MRPPDRYEDRAYCRACGHCSDEHKTPGGCTSGWFCSCKIPAPTVLNDGDVRTGRPVWTAYLA